MKKSLISALTTALVVGAASTTFAASNPFEDVPADHWAYDAVAQLAADGVIEGYGDGTYRGDQEITRYEMAQMVARAMAKGANGTDKALIDKLAAEFADELNNLGVRVSALEKKVDNVKWKGWVGYEYYNAQADEGRNANGARTEGDHGRLQRFQLQLNPVFTINKNWIARGRLKYLTDSNTASNSTGNAPFANGDASGFEMDRLWVQGNYDNFTIKLGKIYHDSAFDGPSGGMIFGNRIAGGIITVGNKLKATIGVGRHNRRPNDNNDDSRTDNMQFLELGYNASEKLNIGVAYYHTSNERAYTLNDTRRFNKSYYRETPANARANSFGTKDRHIAEIGITYKFSPKWLMNLAYARANGGWEMKYKQAYNIEFSYNGGRYPDMSKPGNFGGFIAYRHLGRGAVIAPCYDGMYYNGVSQKGIEIGAAYVFAKNILGTALYFRGKDLGNEDRNSQQFFGALQFYF